MLRGEKEVVPGPDNTPVSSDQRNQCDRERARATDSERQEYFTPKTRSQTSETSESSETSGPLRLDDSP